MIYQWKDGSRFNQIEAQAAGECLEQIRKDAGGNLLPADVVDAARPKRSVLHPAFEWNDSKAAEEFRLEQARSLVRSVVVTIEPGSEAPKTIRAFVSIRSSGDDEEESSVYTSTEAAMADPSLRAQVVRQALREAESFRRRYAQYAELAAIFKAIENVARKVKPDEAA